MSFPQPAQSLGTEFAVFLRAPLWEETSGGTLSLLSAFARLDLDPWQEAARLAALSREAAARRLGEILARLPVSQTDAAFESICARSVGLLPFTPDQGRTGPAPTKAEPSRSPSGIQLGLLAAWMVMLSLLGSQLASRKPGPIAPAPAGAGPSMDAMAPAAASPPAGHSGGPPN
jgi:hypothetical protein